MRRDLIGRAKLYNERTHAIIIRVHRISGDTLNRCPAASRSPRSAGALAPFCVRAGGGQPTGMGPTELRVQRKALTGSGLKPADKRPKCAASEYPHLGSQRLFQPKIHGS